MQVMNDIYGQSSTEPFAVYDPDSSLWRTSQLSFEHPNGEPYLGTWPKQGTMRDGECYEHRTLERHIDESACSLLPTPAAQDPGYKGPLVDKNGRLATHSNQRLFDPVTGRMVQKGLAQAVSLLPTPNARDYKGSPSEQWNGQASLPRSIGGLTSQRSDDGDDSQDRSQAQPTSDDDLAFDLWSG